VSGEPTTQATFCATLVDEWARAGVRHAMVAPGSRSTPMALALAADERIAVHVHHDERCAAFMALGAGLASRVPAVALCTTGMWRRAHAASVGSELGWQEAVRPLVRATAPTLDKIGVPPCPRQ